MGCTGSRLSFVCEASDPFQVIVKVQLDAISKKSVKFFIISSVTKYKCTFTEGKYIHISILILAIQGVLVKVQVYSNNC